LTGGREDRVGGKDEDEFRQYGQLLPMSRRCIFPMVAAAVEHICRELVLDVVEVSDERQELAWRGSRPAASGEAAR
jgi:hypothetical protein